MVDIRHKGEERFAVAANGPVDHSSDERRELKRAAGELRR